MFSWSKLIIEQAKLQGVKVIDLPEDRANKNELTSVLKKVDPDLVIFNGHGGEDKITGQHDEILIKAGENEHILERKIVYALSCQSAKKLGHASIKSGTRAYIGYVEDFVFFMKKGYETRPLEDPWAKLFFEPSNQIGHNLLKGHSAGYAHMKAKNHFLVNMQKLIISNSPDQFLGRYLLLNYVHQVCLGDENAKISD